MKSHFCHQRTKAPNFTKNQLITAFWRDFVFWCPFGFALGMFSGIFIFSSCIQIKKYPDEPAIEFESYSIKDTINGFGDPAQILILKFSFTDGDGDIGLDALDTLPPKVNCKDSACNNLYVNRIGIKGGVSQELPVNYRIPVITPTGQNKTLKGEIDIRLEEFLITPYDTVICEIYIVDRALHQSNVVTTPEIVL